MCRWLPDTTLTYVNEGYCTICGKERAELIGHKWIELVPEHSHEHGSKLHTIIGQQTAGNYFRT